MYCTDPTKQKARVRHCCTWCGQHINPGEEYWRWASFEDAGFTNKMHPECRDACNRECLEARDNEYLAYENERPAGIQEQPKESKDAICPHGIHYDNACGACIPPRGTR